MSTITPAASGIYYDPSSWKVETGKATTIQGGAELKVLVEGNPGDDLTATFDLTGLVAPYPHVAISIDNEPAIRRELAATLPVPKPTTNQWPSHIVTITVVAAAADVNRWNRQSAVVFTGIMSAATAISSGLIRNTSPIGLFIGDSLGEGFWALGTADAYGTAPDRTDNRFGWAYPLARALGCRPIQATFAGVGLTKGGNGSIPKFLSNWKQMWSGEARSFSTQPDYVVAMPGTNDNGATDATVTAEMTAWINDLVATLTNGCPIIIVRPWYGTKAAAIQAGIAASNNPARVKWVDTTGWVNASQSSDGLHPYGFQNLASLVPRLADAVRTILKAAQSTNPPTPIAWIKTASGKAPFATTIRDQ